MNNTSKIIIAAAAGAVAGAILGILFAPAKGKETRENIRKKGKQLADDIAEKLRDVTAAGKEESLN